MAWSALNLAPDRHWYPPGYSLLGAIFQKITPLDCFLVPNLICLALSYFATIVLARRFFPGWHNAGLAGAAAFLVTTVGAPYGLASWLVPWTTTPATAAILLTFVSTLRMVERPNFTRALLAGVALGTITFFRPSDAIPVATAATLVVARHLFGSGRENIFTIATGAVLGASTVVGIVSLIIGATSGFGAGTYYALSSRFGFEPGLIPSRWVTLVISGNPIYDGLGTPVSKAGLHVGLAQKFPWVISGVAGIAACLASERIRAAHVLLGVWLVLHTAMILAYRDLHISGLWLYWNFHYFKPAQPVFMLFTILLLRNLLDRTKTMRSSIAALGAIILAFCWRAELVPIGSLATMSGRILLPSLDHLNNAAIVPGNLTWAALDAKTQKINVGMTQYENSFDFRIYRRQHDMIIVPLRRLDAGRGVLHAPGLKLTNGATVIVARQQLVFGLPCLFNLAGYEICGRLGAPFLS